MSTGDGGWIEVARQARAALLAGAGTGANHITPITGR
jgi:hypothetical protein